MFAHVQDGPREYKLVNPGPQVTPTARQQLLTKLEQLGRDDTLIISGSFAQGIPANFIGTIGQQAASQHFQFVIDTSYPEVLDALQYHPLLVKPNNVELASWFDQPADIDADHLIELGQELRRRGAQNVLISRGGAGAILVGDRVFTGTAPTITVLNSAGSGDTMLGTFVAGMVTGKAPAANLQMALAAGSDTARSAWITDFQHVPELAAQINVTEVKHSQY